MSSEDGVRPVALAWLALGCLLVFLVLWTHPASSFHVASEVLRVRRLEIVDGAGNIRLRAGVAPDGAPSVRLYDGAGIRRLELSVPAEGPGVAVFDAQGKQRAMIVAPSGLVEAETLPEDGNTGP